MSDNLIQRCFFLLGPTAVGKSDLAAALALRIGGEVVGADAFQIYEGLDTLSAKPSPALRAQLPHHLIGEVPIAQKFDVAQYLAAATARIAEIVSRGRVPVVCGGTGMYIRALTHGLSDLPPADPALRAELEAEPLPVLVERLRTLDPAAQVDEKNPRRVIRALEVCIQTGRPFSGQRGEWDRVPAVRGAILTRPREELQERISARTEAMFAAGVVEEVAEVSESALGPTASQMLGLREIRALLAGTISRKACKEAITVATRQYAKRQLTWFRRERGYEWLDLDADPLPMEKLAHLTGSPPSD